MKKTNLLILPQENLYLKTNGTMYNDVKFVTCVKLKTNLASLSVHCCIATWLLPSLQSHIFIFIPA